MRFPSPTAGGTLLRRYKRFLADVRLADGEELTVHCPNPGAMTGLDVPGSDVIVSRSPNPKRKLAWTLELVRCGRRWVGVNTARANGVVAEALRAGRLLPEHDVVSAEVATGTGRRIDFLLERSDGVAPRRCWLEVKSVTLARGRIAQFPDAVTRRGLHHLEALTGLLRDGDRAVTLFLVVRGDCERFRPAEDVDPAYAAGLRAAAAAGVEVLVHAARVRRDGITLGASLPFDLDAGPDGS